LSPHSEKTAAYAAEFAARFGASLILVYVCSPKDVMELAGSTDSRFGDPVIVPEEELENWQGKYDEVTPHARPVFVSGILRISSF
jgi:hypothetical protein